MNRGKIQIHESSKIGCVRVDIYYFGRGYYLRIGSKGGCELEDLPSKGVEISGVDLV